MTYYKRISDNDLTGDFVDGSLLLHTDMNEIETLTKTGINANYEDIQKLQDGTLVVGKASTADSATNATNATQLGGATLSKSTDETLQNVDTKVSTSKQVKNYVDTQIANIVTDYPDLTNKPSINGVTLIGNKTSADLGLSIPIYYFNGLNTADNVAMFNEICGLFDNGQRFILVGKMPLQNGYTDEGVFYDRVINVVTPINIKNFTEYEEEGATYLSFMTEPVRTTEGYAIGSVKLTGTWGHFTAIEPITWAYSEGPAKVGDLADVAFSGDYTDLLNKITQTSQLINDGESGSRQYLEKDSSSGINYIDLYTDNVPYLDVGAAHTDVFLQKELVSGTNIKTINNQSILGSGNLNIQGSGSITDVQINSTSIVSNDIANLVTNTAYNASSNKIATMTDIQNAIGSALGGSY